LPVLAKSRTIKNQGDIHLNEVPFLVPLIIAVPLFAQVPEGFGQDSGANTS
jgi:hypothetical protein